MIVWKSLAHFNFDRLALIFNSCWWRCWCYHITVLNQGLLYTWRDSIGTFFATFIIMKIFKNDTNTICRSSKSITFFPKFGGCRSKIEPSTPISILKFKRAWQTQFFSHTLQILVNDRFFIGNQMIFYSIFCISNRKAEIWEKLLFPFLSSPQVVIIVHNHGFFYHLGATLGSGISVALRLLFFRNFSRGYTLI